jgi:hypothetical protein
MKIIAEKVNKTNWYGFPFFVGKECPIPVIADKYWASHAESSKKTASLEGDI